MKAELFIANNNIEVARAITAQAPSWATVYDTVVDDYYRSAFLLEKDVRLSELMKFINSYDLVIQLKGIERCKDLIIQCEHYNCSNVSIQANPVCTLEELKTAVVDFEILYPSPTS